jgi:superfamily II DNA or RNA helicase
MSRPTPREWQLKALDAWRANGGRGIIEVVTGGGKTIFALMCVDEIKPDTCLIVVPTQALLDQWWSDVCHFFNFSLDEVCILTGNRSIRKGTINIGVLNTVAKLAGLRSCPPVFLVVDECHKAASEQFRQALCLETVATLGLSATPERPYDDWLNEILVPALGPVLVRYTYKEALKDGVVVPFTLRNVIFELEAKRQLEYDKLTKAIAMSIRRRGVEAPETLGLLLRRARVLNLSENRIRHAIRIVLMHKGLKILIFHEDIEACNIIAEVLKSMEIRASVYHSRLTLRMRAQILTSFRSGSIEILVTCRALDEGFNVPETEIGIIAASTATQRQRIQRLGRVLRPTAIKSSATVYTLVATTPEIERLRAEESELEGVADVSWSRL